MWASPVRPPHAAHFSPGGRDFASDPLRNDRQVRSPVLVNPLLRETAFELPLIMTAVQSAKVRTAAAQLATMRRKRRADRHVVDGHDRRFIKHRDRRHLQALLV